MEKETAHENDAQTERLDVVHQVFAGDVDPAALAMFS